MIQLLKTINYYISYKRGKFVNVNYLLDKLDVSENLPREIYNHFNSNLTNLRKKIRKIPVDYSDDGQILLRQTSESVINNNIKIKDLDKGILRVRYSNSRKLTNKLLKDYYKISKRMVNAIKFNKDIHKLSDNEENIYYELQKFLNKEQDINILYLVNWKLFIKQ